MNLEFIYSLFCDVLVFFWYTFAMRLSRPQGLQILTIARENGFGDQFGDQFGNQFFRLFLYWPMSSRLKFLTNELTIEAWWKSLLVVLSHLDVYCNTQWSFWFYCIAGQLTLSATNQNFCDINVSDDVVLVSFNFEDLAKSFRVPWNCSTKAPFFCFWENKTNQSKVILLGWMKAIFSISRNLIVDRS